MRFVMGVIPQALKIHGDNIGNVVFHTNVAGTTFVKDSDKILEFLKFKVSEKDIRIRLEREPDNQYDSNAVRVEVSVVGAKKFFKIGYIPKDKNEIVSYVLEHEDEYFLKIQNIRLFGGDEMRPNIGVYFDYMVTML